MRSRHLGLILLQLAGPVAASEDRSSTCHIHPPGSTPRNPVNIIGPIASLAECEAERQRRFPGEGRCHCQADFTPRWYPIDPTADEQRAPSDLL